MTRRIALVLIIVLAGRGPVSGQAKRPITDTDIMTFVWVSEGQISPDGTRVVFTRVTANAAKDSYETALWLAPADGSVPPRPLTAGTRDSSPRWSPDGRTLALVRAVERDGRPQPAQIFVLPLDGGEARAVTDVPRGAGAPAWSPDGKRIAFSSNTGPGDGTDAKPAAGNSDVRVITSAVYRSNGGGWNDPDRRSHIWVTDVRPGEIATAVQLTDGQYSEAGHAWSPDGARLYFSSTRTDDPYYGQSDSDLYAVPAAGGAMTRIASINGTIGAPRPSPDGQWIAFNGTANGTPERSYDQPDLFVAAADGSGTPRNLTATYDFDIGGGIGGDQRAPRGGGAGGAIWAADGRSIITVAGEQGDANLVRIDVASGAVTPIYQRAHTVQAYSATPDAKTVVAVVSSGTTINDLFVVDTAAGTASARQITRLNEPLFSSIALSEPEEVWWTSFDGRRIQGWVLHPPAFDPSTYSGSSRAQSRDDKTKQYPLVLQIHGGPHAAYGNVFTHEFHLLAAKGYVVLFPNPRGSSNYGQEFGNIIQYRYPGDDYKDLMAGVDTVVKRGYIDPKRMGIIGGSGGGLLTNWAITQTDRFAAAVSLRSIADWSGFWYTADFSQFTPSWFRQAPWEDAADYAARSPITHVAKVRTPLMLIDGDDDLRTPPSDGGEMMFRALKFMKVPTVMVRFPGETHELSRSGTPKHRVERLQHIVSWFDKYLQGKSVTTYDERR